MTITGTFVLPSKIFKGTMFIKDGKIAEIQENIISNPDYNFLDSYILPGLIEVHGHFREPGFSQKEDVTHATKAAIAGGFTTIIDMPNTNPPTITKDLLDEKQKSFYAGKSYTDYSFFIGVSKDSLSELERIENSSIVGAKVFMAGHETTPTTIPDDETLSKVFEICAQKNILLAVHAEDQELINRYNEELKKTSRTDPALWSELRPKEVVIKAVERAIKLAKLYKTKLYILHASTPEEFTLIEQAKKDGVEIFGEIASYQLIFNTSDYERLGNKIKVAPALRAPKVQDALWKLFRTQTMDVVCSEHTPHEWESKNQPNVWQAQSGMPNIQETLPGLITKWVKRYGKENLEEGLQTIARLSSFNTAKIFGFSQKGSLEVGKDADLVVINTNEPWTVKRDDILSKCGWTAYEGMELIGRPQATFLRGSLVYQEKTFPNTPGGRLVSIKNS